MFFLRFPYLLFWIFYSPEAIYYTLYCTQNINGWAGKYYISYHIQRTVHLRQVGGFSSIFPFPFVPEVWYTRRSKSCCILPWCTYGMRRCKLLFFASGCTIVDVGCFQFQVGGLLNWSFLGFRNSRMDVMGEMKSIGPHQAEHFLAEPWRYGRGGCSQTRKRISWHV